MGKQSHDIDFALDDMDGEAFTLLLKKYCENNKVQGKISGMGVTKFNPEQSKNLKTATVKINDNMIDIVNLRSEKYTEDSRIPVIEIGTPKQDALRRDLTINALFYNIVTQQVEDYTGQGLDDIKNGIIRTPLGIMKYYLDPYITFKDDPLRILRVFRFAGRFNFKIMPNILEAASRKDIQQFLRVKVSKERVGIQLNSMLKGLQPQQSLSHILESGLWNIVFEIPQNSTLTDNAVIESIPKRSFNLLKDIKQNLKAYPQFIQNQEVRVGIYVSALTYVYEPYVVKMPKGLPVPLIQYIVKNSLKRSNSEADFPLRVNQGVAGILKLISSKQENQISLIKWLLAVGKNWQLALLLAQTVEQKQKQQILKFKQKIVDNKWSELYNLQLPVNGTYLGKQLNKKGKVVGIILNNLKLWRILNPDKSNQEVIAILQAQIERFQNPDMYE